MSCDQELDSQSEAPTVSPFDVGKLSDSTFVENLPDNEKNELIEKCWQPSSKCVLDKQRVKINKTVQFQRKWLEQRKWLSYSANPSCCGGWCTICLLFLTTKEKSSLGAFVTTAFRNYNKSKEKLDGHESTDYHNKAQERAMLIKAQLQNIENRIDVQLDQVTSQNVRRNQSILPNIVDVVSLCAKQQIPLRGHRDHKIQFTEAPTCNEGNFIAIIRLLSETNSNLKEHLERGPRNAQYTSKTIQNEVIEVMAEEIRKHFRECLAQCPHFSLIADETTSHGREILSVCLRFLDFVSSPNKPVKREVLIDLRDLHRATGKVIASALLESLEKHSISITDCRGQAYDTTSSMSSSNKGVQAEIARHAPDADYQGCCLHSLNLVICHACDMRSIQNMLDTCRELYSFFDNSPKRQAFLNIVIDALEQGETKKRRLKNLCKTRWIERHSTFETIHDLYQYIVITLDEICDPSDDDRFKCPEEETWAWDAKTRTMANGLRHTMRSFAHIVSFVCSMVMLEPMRPIVSALQGRLVEVYFGFQKIDQVTDTYNDIRCNIDSFYDRMYTNILALAELVGSEEQRPRTNPRQTHRENIPAETTKVYWKRTIVIPFLDVIISELKSRFSQEKRAHYELCSLLPTVICKKNDDEITNLIQVLKRKWEHLLPLPAAFEIEIFRWVCYCKKREETTDESATSIIANHADEMFFPNIRELFKILAVLPIGSTEAERSFSCLRRLHTWLRSNMNTERLSDLAVIAMNSSWVNVSTKQICHAFMEKHPRRMTEASILQK